MSDNLNNSAFLYGESVFTTCLVKNGEIELWQEHFEQLVANAVKFFFLEQQDSSKVKEMVLEALKSVEVSDGALRISIYSNETNALTSKSDLSNLVVDISQRKIAWSKEAYKLKTCYRSQDTLLDELKIGSYGKEFYLKQIAINEGFDDVLFCCDKKIYESSTANIFFIKGEKLLTPKSGIYKGIIRKKIIENNDVEQRDILFEELENFDGVFITNSLFKILPVVQIDNVCFKMSPLKVCVGESLRGKIKRG